MKRGTNALSISAQVVLWLPPRMDTGKETLRIQFKHWSPHIQGSVITYLRQEGVSE